MQRESALVWSWMNVLNQKRISMLREAHGDLDKALARVSLEMLMELGCGEAIAMKAMNRMEEFDLDAYEAALKKRDVVLLSIEDDAYPAILKTLPDPPMFLYVRGDLAVLTQPLVAIVGSREMSDYGKRVTEHLVAPMIAAGVVTVSGLAYGIDAEVASETLRANGKTVAVLGHGLGMIYPKANEKLADRIVKAGGLLISEFPLDVQPDKYTFPARNRIIAGLASGTVVAQAAKDSGSLITADLALDYGRDVFAVSGSIFDPQFEGCHYIISRGVAKLITCAEDVLQELGMVVAETGNAIAKEKFVSDSPDEEALANALTSMPAPLDALLVRTKLDAATANALLTMLEIKGVARNVGSGQWVRA